MHDELSECEPAAIDDDLVVRARTDRAAFELLYERYYPRVARYCLRRLADRTIAEDVTADVFLQVASHLGTFAGRGETDFRRWLFRIATNAINAQRRQSLRRTELLQAAAERGQFERAVTAPPRAAEHDRLDWPAVRAAIERLEQREQTIVTLRFFAGCSHEEIAAVIDMSAGAVRTALSRALARLRAELNPERTPD